MCRKYINIILIFFFFCERVPCFGRARKFHKRNLSWPSEKVPFAKRSPVEGQKSRIRRRPPNRDKRRRLSRFHAYSDVALNPTLIRRYKVFAPGRSRVSIPCPWHTSKCFCHCIFSQTPKFCKGYVGTFQQLYLHPATDSNAKLQPQPHILGESSAREFCIFPASF